MAGHYARVRACVDAARLTRACVVDASARAQPCIAAKHGSTTEVSMAVNSSFLPSLRPCIACDAATTRASTSRYGHACVQRVACCATCRRIRSDAVWCTRGAATIWFVTFWLGCLESSARAHVSTIDMCIVATTRAAAMIACRRMGGTSPSSLPSGARAAWSGRQLFACGDFLLEHGARDGSNPALTARTC